MLRQSAAWLPHPLLSLLLLVLWLLLNNTATPGHLVLGAVLGIIIPLFTRRFWPQRLVVGHFSTVMHLAGRVVADIIRANFSVAKVVLGPRSAIRPMFVKVPLDVESDFAVSLLASVISLTPGTVSADIDVENRCLLVHALSTEDPDDLVQQIKSRYEALIKEIFP